MTKDEYTRALHTAGFRELYAVKHGTASHRVENGHDLYTYTYGKEHDFQDANGATYDATVNTWIG